MSTIELTNIGPIEHLVIPVPERGGLCVLRGRNGRGKTKALEAVESALTGRGKLDVRDGALRGEVEAFGVTLKIGRSTRRTGELEVQSLDGRLSPAELVDPGLKSPEAADARRIKALVQIAGVRPDPALFHALVGGREEFERLVSSHAITAEDLVVMADRVKRDLEAAARNRESQADHAEGRARGARQAAGDIDVSQPCDAPDLQARHEEAIRDEAALRQRAQAAEESRKARQAAQDALEDAEACYEGATLDEAQHRVEVAARGVQSAKLTVEVARRALLKAETDLRDAESSLQHADALRHQAGQHETLVAAWREALARPLPPAVDPGALDGARRAVEETRQAVETGVLVRRAKQHLEDALAAATEATEQRREAERLREAAKGTDEVLSGVVAQTGTPLRVEAGRLVLETRRGSTYFADLSHGERWKLAIDVSILQVGERGVIPIPQEAYEGLDPIARREIADHLVERGVVALTAEASEDEDVRAEVYG